MDKENRIELYSIFGFALFFILMQLVHIGIGIYSVVLFLQSGSFPHLLMIYMVLNSFTTACCLAGLMTMIRGVE